MAVIAGRLMRESRKRDVEVSTAIKVFASHIVTLAGIVIACILCFAMLSLMVPGYLHAGMADKLLTGGPASSLKDKTDGLSVDVFMAATIINFSVGSFISIIFPFFLKRNQPSDNRQPKPFHQLEQ